jgi:hypothetical protein
MACMNNSPLLIFLIHQQQVIWWCKQHLQLALREKQKTCKMKKHINWKNSNMLYRWKSSILSGKIANSPIQNLPYLVLSPQYNSHHSLQSGMQEGKLQLVIHSPATQCRILSSGMRPHSFSFQSAQKLGKVKVHKFWATICPIQCMFICQSLHYRYS